MQDADSLEHTDGEKKEGAFYVWTKQEVDAILGNSEQAKLFDGFYNVQPQGNATLSPRRSTDNYTMCHSSVLHPLKFEFGSDEPPTMKRL